MRGFVVGLVVLHHATLAYCTFGHIDRVNYARSTAPIVDPQRWVVFDLVVRLDDGFFMPLLFLLSGLFVRDGLIRHGPAAFLGTRIRRLGLPFAIAILTVGPLAYYPSFLQAGGTPGFGSFWIRTVTAGPWPSGPPWFIGVLLLFDVAATLVFILASRCIVGPVPPPRRARSPASRCCSPAPACSTYPCSSHSARRFGWVSGRSPFRAAASASMRATSPRVSDWGAGVCRPSCSSRAACLPDGRPGACSPL
ncbi:acyltransferase family protein [Methylobacterium gregans]|uniref:acyltransferase family protein n=1 Tax=Methylobacterium gregans TaxID=374424 RepID=UPI00361BAE80